MTFPRHKNFMNCILNETSVLLSSHVTASVCMISWDNGEENDEEKK